DDVLNTIGPYNVDSFRIRNPPRARNQVALDGVTDVQPLRLTAIRRYNAEPHTRVVFPGLRITLWFIDRARAPQSLVGIKGLAACIELQIRDRLRIRRPPIGRAQLQLFGVNPIRRAVAQSIRSACGNATLLA